MLTEKEKEFEARLQGLKDAITEHNDNRKFWQPKWHLNENYLFFSITYNGFPNPFNIHRGREGWNWSAFPKGRHILIKLDPELICETMTPRGMDDVKHMYKHAL